MQENTPQLHYTKRPNLLEHGHCLPSQQSSNIDIKDHANSNVFHYYYYYYYKYNRILTYDVFFIIIAFYYKVKKLLLLLL